MKLPAYLTGFSSKSDGSASLRFNTNELTGEDFAELKRELNEFGWLVFAPEGQTVEVPNEKITDERKKPSQRLRAVLYLLFKKSYANDEAFESWYRTQIEKMIDRIKEKLD
jgi:hypothetical protein